MKERDPGNAYWASLYARQIGSRQEADKARRTLAPGLRRLPVEETSSGLQLSSTKPPGRACLNSVPASYLVTDDFEEGF